MSAAVVEKSCYESTNAILFRPQELIHLLSTSPKRIGVPRSETRSGTVEFIVADAQQYTVEPASLDVVLCMGASHAFGLGATAYRNALERMFLMVRPGGQLLVTEGYAKQPVPDGYREFIGDTLTDEMTHEANVRLGTSLGLIPLGAWTSSEDEWDQFEWSYQRIIEQTATGPDTEEALAEKLIHRRKWMEGYLRWGRDTLGYGTYLFRKPAQ